MRAALIALTVLLLPAALFAEGTIGVYFGAGNGVYYSPAQYEEFSGYVLISGLDCYISAAEFMVQVPTGIQITGFSIPDGSVSLGDPALGVSITYWPPLNGYDGDSHLLCTVNFLAKKGCGVTGIQDGAMVIVPDPEAVSGAVVAVCWPDYDKRFPTGLTSIICPTQIGVESKSWGSIKSLYDK
jgi:hypothetical protein